MALWWCIMLGRQNLYTSKKLVKNKRMKASWKALNSQEAFLGYSFKVGG